MGEPDQIRSAVANLRSNEVGSLTESIETLKILATKGPNVELIIQLDAIPPVVRCLKIKQLEEHTASLIGLIANNPRNQTIIYDAGALPMLVAMLRRHMDSGVISKAVYAIKQITHQMPPYKDFVRSLEGIRLLVLILKSMDVILESMDLEIMRDVARLLCSLVRNENSNKTEIVDCDALPTLILMLRSENPTINHEAVRVIDALTHSSNNELMDLVFSHALQPIIDLLRCTSSETRILAALLIARYAAVNSYTKAYIVQRGALGSLVEMVQSEDEKLKDVSSLALGRLANDPNGHNQVGITHAGGIPALLNLLDSGNNKLQHNSAFALKGLALSEDIVSDFVRAGGVEKLLDREYVFEPTRKCVDDTLTRLGNWIHVKRVIINIILKV